jgi:copper chaperone CopZ
VDENPRYPENVMKNTQTTLSVLGMSCPSCTSHLKEALRALDGVEAVIVRFEEGTVVVTHDQRVASADELIAALQVAGYEASPAHAAA